MSRPALPRRRMPPDFETRLLCARVVDSTGFRISIHSIFEQDLAFLSFVDLRTNFRDRSSRVGRKILRCSGRGRISKIANENLQVCSHSNIEKDVVDADRTSSPERLSLVPQGNKFKCAKRILEERITNSNYRILNPDISQAVQVKAALDEVAGGSRGRRLSAARFTYSKQDTAYPRNDSRSLFLTADQRTDAYFSLSISSCKACPGM